MPERHARFWAQPSDLDRLFGATHVCYLTSDYEGSTDYPALTRLLAGLAQLAVVEKYATPVLVVRIACRQAYAELARSAVPSLNRTCLVYCERSPSLLPDVPSLGTTAGLFEMANPPQAYSHIITAEASPLSFPPRAEEPPEIATAVRAWVGGLAQNLTSERLPGPLGPDGLAVLQTVSASLPLAMAPSTGCLPTRESIQHLIINLEASFLDAVNADAVQLRETAEQIVHELRVTTERVVVNLADVGAQGQHLGGVGNHRMGSTLSNKYDVCTYHTFLADDLCRRFASLHQADLTICSSYHLALTSLALGLPTIILRTADNATSALQQLNEHYGLLPNLSFDLSDGGRDPLVQVVKQLARDETARTRIAATTTRDTLALMGGLRQWERARDGWLAAVYTDERERQHRTVAGSLVKTQARLSDLLSEYDRLLGLCEDIDDVPVLRKELHVYRTALRYQLVDRFNSALLGISPLHRLGEIVAHVLFNALGRVRR